MQDSCVPLTKWVIGQNYHLCLCLTLSAFKGLSMVFMLYQSPFSLHTYAVNAWQDKRCSNLFTSCSCSSLEVLCRCCYRKQQCQKSVNGDRLCGGSLSCMGSTCCRKKGAEWWHGQWIWEMVAHGCSSSSFWGSPGFAQLAVFIPSLSTLSSKHQQEGTSMRSNTQCCILLCILLVSQRQVRYFAASESSFCCPSAMF